MCFLSLALGEISAMRRAWLVLSFWNTILVNEAQGSPCDMAHRGLPAWSLGECKQLVMWTSPSPTHLKPLESLWAKGIDQRDAREQANHTNSSRASPSGTCNGQETGQAACRGGEESDRVG